MKKLIIIGGGHASAQLCNALTQGGFEGTVTLVSAEAQLPYHRPPLSKAFLKDAATELQPIRGEQAYVDAGIELCLGDAVTAVDRAEKVVSLASGRQLPYDILVLATGTRARRVPGLPAGVRNVAYLRDAADARQLREALAGTAVLTVLGGGFIGLEAAATAALLGKKVHVFEAAPRLLSRAVSPEMAAHVEQVLTEAGVHLHLGQTATGFDIEDDRIVSMEVLGEQHPVELLLAGIGAVAETTLAEAMGLVCENGVVVDAHLLSSDPSIYAIGDCTAFPYARWDRRLRLESVQNANDQAAALAATLTGKPAPYTALPWFWSEQGAMRIQIAGLLPAQSERLIRPGAKPGSFSVLHYEGDRLTCVESANAPMDHMAARTLLTRDISPERSAAIDASVPLKSWA